MELPTLYARSETGAILEWTIIADCDSFYTISGQQDGQKVKSKLRVCKGKNTGKKNATTPREQAIAEAEAKWDKKLRSGGYWENVSDIDKQMLFIEPMLANKFEKHKHKIAYPLMVDRKYNGMRQITSIKGSFSRKGEEIHTAPHIFESLKFLFEKFPMLVLDGELYNHEYRFKLNELMKLVRKSKHFTKEDLKNSKEIVKYYVYDAYGFSINGVKITEQTGNLVRRMSLIDLLFNIPFIETVPFEKAENEEKVYSLFESYIKDGYEGAITRNINAPYQHKRTNDLLKVKPEDDSEAVILSVMEGEGNWSGAAKTATIKWKDKIFDASFKGSYEELVNVLKNKEDWIGKEVTFLYMGKTGKGVANFARIDINNCFKS